MNKVIHGDCLIESEQIASGSVDLILTDLPYGIMEPNHNGVAYKKMYGDKLSWDFAMPPDKIHETGNRLLRKNGKMVLFAREPYTSKLVTTAIPNLPYSYKMIWESNTFGSHLKCNKAPLGFFDEILVFSKYVEDKLNHTLQDYFMDELRLSRQSVKDICRELKTTHASHFFTRGMQFRVPNEDYLKQLRKLTGRFNIDYSEIRQAQDDFLEWQRTEYPATFNLWEGKKYKSNILKYAKDYDGYHPTQKPVLLLEDLIKTFSNEGDLVVDLTAGSGSTAVACINTGRNYIMIENEKKYFDIINNRIAEYEQQLTITL